MEKEVITPDKVARLEGRPVKLSSTYTNGKLLTIDPRGQVTIENPGMGFDQRWRFLPINEGKGFLLTSFKQGDMICHRMKDGGEVSSRPLSSHTNDCIWEMTNKGEIYQKNPEGGERYLWLAKDELFATTDGFLAESWVPLSDIELPLPVEPDNSTQGIVLIVCLVGIFVILTLTKRG